MREIKKLDDLMDGALTERFNDALAQVLGNVFDPNTDPEKVREIALVVKLTPNARRDAAEFKTDVKVKLAPPVPLVQTVLMEHRDDGTVIAMERTDQVPGQMDIAGDETKPKSAEFGQVVAFPKTGRQ